MTRKQYSIPPNNAYRNQVIDLAYMGSQEESAESRTVASRERFRGLLSDDVERFLSQGGHIDHVEPHVTSTPSVRPASRYGDRSL